MTISERFVAAFITGERWKLYISGLGITLEIALFAGILGKAAVTGNVVAGEHDQVGLILLNGMLDKAGGEVGEQHIVLNIGEIQHAEAAVFFHVKMRTVGGRCRRGPGGHADQRQHQQA